MTSLLASMVSTIRAPRGRLFFGLSLLALAGAFAGTVFAQAPAAGAAPAADDVANANGRNRRNQNGGNRGNFDPAQMQEQMMTRLREQFGVTDDAEWKLITDRITAVTELRRATGGGLGGFAGGFGGGRGGQAAQAGGGGQGGARAGRGGAVSPEQDALRQAVADKLPDAEIKARLARLRDVRKANEEKLTKAQEDLRAVLDLRQEAVAVMAGLLP